MKQELMLVEEEIKEVNAEIVYFGIQDLLPIGMTFIVLGIGLVFGLQVMGDVKSDTTADTYEYNASVQTIQAVSKIPAKLSIIVTVVIAAILLGILVRYLMVRFG